MQLCRIGRTRSRAVAGLAALATAVSLVVVAHPASSATPPPNPTNGQIQRAKNQKAALADQVGQLTARVATLTALSHQLEAEKELAEQKVALAVSKLQQAQDTAKQTAQDAVAAEQQVQQAQREFVEYAQASYMSGDVQGMTGTLLTASDPNTLLQESALQGYQATHQLSAIDNLQRATVAKSNADAAARKAVDDQTKAAAAAKQAEQDAASAVAAAQAQQQQVTQTLSASQSQLDAAQLRLHTLNGQRAAYQAWRQHQIELRKARERRLRLARERAARLAQQHQSQGGGGGGGGSVGGGSASAPSGGTWTARKAAAAVHRAEQYLGTMYAWAGGNAYGPTRGVCAGDGAWNDCNVVGFDCSGLVMYAWGPNLPLDHYAATQYTQAGSYHPSPGNFKPGDLLFWSSNGTIGGIHHVAIYIGGGLVIQAPESGEVVQETPWDQVSWGYFDATRPLT
ncbi:MAG TPA: NlpC/P60 family protein [Jatrophihabitantaceae bacterium]|nr:NlpC/P60 family protein [Jatrophihabitantaceae bacterium]